MANSLLTIVQNVDDELGDFETLNTVIGNSNPTAKILLAMMRAEGRELLNRHDWTALMVEQTFTLATSDDDDSAPSDFLRMINETHWDTTNNFELNGPTSPQDWRILKNAVTGDDSKWWWRMRGGDWEIHPVPVAGDIGVELIYEYISNKYITTNGSTTATWTTDADTPRLPDSLFEMGAKWRCLRAKGLPYADERNDYENQLQVEIGRDGARKTLRMDSRPRQRPLGPGSVSIST